MKKNIALLLFLLLQAVLTGENKVIMKMNAETYYIYWLVSPEYKQLPDRLRGDYNRLLFVKCPIESLTESLPKMNKTVSRRYLDVSFDAPPELIREYNEHQKQLAEELLGFPALFVKTYARDSIWNTDFSPFKPANGIRLINSKSGTMEMEGELYKYFPADLAEVIGLLKKPEGTLPISRIASPTAGQQEFIKALLAKLIRAL